MFVVNDVFEVLLFHVEAVGDDLYEIVDCLDRFDQVWRKCCAFLIENQIPVNRRACKIQHCIMTFFVVRFGPFKTTLGISSKLKTFGAKCEDKRQRKLYCVNFAEKYLVENWPHLLTQFNAMKKKDDIADALCQWLAFCKINGFLVE